MKPMGNKKRENLKQRLEVPSVRLKNSLALEKEKELQSVVYTSKSRSIIPYTQKYASTFNTFVKYHTDICNSRTTNDLQFTED
jgi:hypothetical protein